MNALAVEEDLQAPRLFSTRWKPRSLLSPADDVVAPEHSTYHMLLNLWGMWARRRAPNSSLASIERLYTKGDTPPSTAPLSADPRVTAIEDAIVQITEWKPKRLLLMMYLFRCSNYTICRAVKIKFQHYPQETYKARQLVVDLYKL